MPLRSERTRANFKEYNHNHVPGGSPEGGEFAGGTAKQTPVSKGSVSIGWNPIPRNAWQTTHDKTGITIGGYDSAEAAKAGVNSALARRVRVKGDRVAINGIFHGKEWSHFKKLPSGAHVFQGRGSTPFGPTERPALSSQSLRV